jgi:hypothetical protein
MIRALKPIGKLQELLVVAYVIEDCMGGFTDAS